MAGRRPSRKKLLTIGAILVALAVIVGIVLNARMDTDDSNVATDVDKLASPAVTPGNVSTYSQSPGTAITISEAPSPVADEITQEALETQQAIEDTYQEVQDYSHITENPPSAGLDIASSVGKNYLLIGSDSREGSNSSVAGDAVSGQRSDTTMVAHVSADNSRVDIISIPRDTMVTIPACNLASGGTTAYVPAGMFNSAFSSGDSLASAIACTMATVETNTGVRIDGYALVDFSGFEAIVDELGGIEVNVPERMVSSKAGLDVQPGPQTMDGATALAYSRARIFEVGGGDGSDLSRISRQQDVVNGIMSKLFSLDSVAHPVRTYNTLQAINQNAVLSDNLNSYFGVGGLALTLSKASINYYTTPTVPYTYDYNRVMWTQETLNMWQNVHDDVPLN